MVLDTKLRKKTVSYAACMSCAEKVLFRPGKQRSVIIMLFNSSIRYVICTHFVGKCTISVISHVRDCSEKKRLVPNYSTNEKSNIFAQSLWNFVYLTGLWIGNIAWILSYLEQNCGFLIIGIFFGPVSIIIRLQKRLLE